MPYTVFNTSKIQIELNEVISRPEGVKQFTTSPDDDLIFDELCSILQRYKLNLTK